MHPCTPPLGYAPDCFIPVTSAFRSRIFRSLFFVAETSSRAFVAEVKSVAKAWRHVPGSRLATKSPGYEKSPGFGYEKPRLRAVPAANSPAAKSPATKGLATKCPDMVFYIDY